MKLRFKKTLQGIVLSLTSEQLNEGVQISDLIELFSCMPKGAHIYRIAKNSNNDEVELWVSFVCEGQLIRAI